MHSRCPERRFLPGEPLRVQIGTYHVPKDGKLPPASRRVGERSATRKKKEFLPSRPNSAATGVPQEVSGLKDR